VYSALAGDRLPEVIGGVGAGGCALTAAALAFRWPSVLPVGLAGVGAAYAIFLSLRAQTADSRAPAVAAAFFAAAELAYWSLERVEGRRDRSLPLRRLGLLGATTLGVALLGAFLLVLTSGASGGVVLEAIGVVAAVVTAALITGLAARARA
jgi:putative flippase GtrA